MADQSISKPAELSVFAARQGVTAAPGVRGAGNGLAMAAVAAAVFAALVMGYAFFSGSLSDDPAIAQKPRSTEDFPANYQNDPSARIARAIKLDQAGKAFAAEMELRDALALAEQNPGGQAIHEHARTLLAVVMFKDGRRWAAWQMAGDLCRGAPRPENRRLLEEAKVCD